MVGTCRDRLADAFERYGRVPIVTRTSAVGVDHPAFRRSGEAPLWSAAGLVHDSQCRVLLVRHAAPSAWGDLWVTPGGWLEEGETTTDGFRREVREEVGLRVVDLSLARILNEALTCGDDVRHVYVAQFVAASRKSDVALGPGIREARWFSRLPAAMAYREDYLEDSRRLRGQRL